MAPADADEVATRAAAIGATTIEPAADRPWSAREVLLADPDGYRLTFTAPTAELAARVQGGRVPKFDEVLARMRGRVGPGAGPRSDSAE